MDHRGTIDGEFHGEFVVDGRSVNGGFTAKNDGGSVLLLDSGGHAISRGNEVQCASFASSTFTLHDVAIGLGFHWERRENQTFFGDLKLMARPDGTVVAISLVSLEQYLASVVSSEMSGSAPFEFLKSHAIASRSWLMAMLQREKKNIGIPAQRSREREGEIIRWYDREDHDLYDVCADDHCQRYQGITKILLGTVVDAVNRTRGTSLAFDGNVCDARFSKACGGLTEHYESCWDDTAVPYLRSVGDAVSPYPPIQNEEQAESWIRSSPDAYCNTDDTSLLRQILPKVDLETSTFFRWRVEYPREELEELVRSKSGIDFGTLMELSPVQRGPSGRLVKLKIAGTKHTVVVGKELEIRRWLAKSHLYSSAFVVDVEGDSSGVPMRFVLHGCGWGHGVGMCQIGAAVMASQGKTAEEILTHYYRGAKLKKLYD
jgi:SpoIID/LytB domain protein